MPMAIASARWRRFQNGNRCRTPFSATGFRIREQTPNSGCLITMESQMSRTTLLWITIWIVVAPFAFAADDPTVEVPGHKEFAPDTVRRSRAPALELAARRLRPPYLRVEAGASSAVCSEAGASEQEYGSPRIRKTDGRCGTFRSRSERRLFAA